MLHRATWSVVPSGLAARRCCPGGQNPEEENIQAVVMDEGHTGAVEVTAPAPGASVRLCNCHPKHRWSKVGRELYRKAMLEREHQGGMGK